MTDTHRDPLRGAPTRRDFLRGAATASAVTLAWPHSLRALARRLSPAAAQSEQEFWSVVREAFLIPDDRIYLNVGTLGAQPRPVVDAVIEHTRRVAMTYPPGVNWDELKGALGRFVHGDPAGLVFPRNTTEGMNFVANGLDWKAGDEILTTTHEHIGGLCCWQLATARHGLTLRQLPLPIPPESGEQLVDIFRRAITSRTRVISISHLTFTTGLVMPVREIVDLGRRHGIIVAVDGAHPPGLMAVDIQALDPDFYASSPHKWLLAPQGTGFLYIRENWRTRLWPTLASGDWDNKELGAQRFNHLGTFDESRMAGLLAALRFQEAIGMDRIATRIRQHRRHLLDRLGAVRGVQIVSPPDDALGAGMVSFKVAGIESLELQRRLAREANVRTRVVSEYDYGFMRLSAHIYNSPEEIDRVVDLIATAAAG